MVVTSTLLVTVGRISDMLGRVKMYNLGFAVFTLGLDPPVPDAEHRHGRWHRGGSVSRGASSWRGLSVRQQRRDSD